MSLNIRGLRALRQLAAVLSLFAAWPIVAAAQRQMEFLDRGVVAIRQANDSVFLSWRMLGTDPDDVAFNLYRRTGDADAVKLNDAPITDATNFVDAKADLTQDNFWHVRPILGGKEMPPGGQFKLPAGARPNRTSPSRSKRRTATNPAIPRSATSTATASTKSSSTRSAAAATTPSAAAPPSRSSKPTSSTARGCGGSTSAGTSAKAPTTRSSWSTTSTATAGPKSPARRPTARSTAPAR